MSELVITLEDAARSLPDLVERVHSNGEPALITKSGQALARLVPIPIGEQGAEDLIAFLRRWRVEHPEPDEQFTQAIKDSRRAIGHDGFLNA